MKKLFYLTETAYNDLYDHRVSNEQNYFREEPWLKEYFGEREFCVESRVTYPEFKLVNSENKTKDDVINTKIVYDALGNILTPRQACNKYMWTYLAHEEYWEYTRGRWSAERGASIKTRYFCGDSRIPLSLNSLSRLWWYGYLTYDEENTDNPYYYTELMVSDTDLCQNLVQHKYSMDKKVLLGILEGIEHFTNMGEPFSVEMERELIKYINRYGAVSNLDILERNEIMDLVRSYLMNNKKSM